MPGYALPSDIFPASRLVLAARPSARLKGLLFDSASDNTMMLVPCHDVHTFGMKYAIDMAFVNKEGRVLSVRRDVLPNKRVKHDKAVAVLERRAQPKEVWFEVGDELVLSPYQLYSQVAAGSTYRRRSGFANADGERGPKPSELQAPKKEDLGIADSRSGDENMPDLQGSML